MKRLWQVGLILLLCVPLWGNTAVFANAPTTSHQPTLVEAQEEALVEAQELLDAMSVEERVGQLFLVTFEGSAVDNQSDIADLILNYHVGGVALQAENDNIEDLAQLTRLTNDLQSLALTGTTLSAGDPITPTASLTMTAVTPTPAPTPTLPDTPLPLLIAINHEGDGAPYSEILSELTAVPNNMAIGATWQPQNAQIVGEIVGRELTSIGVNMLFGPSLDVLENPDPAKPADLGTRSFGGDPYWVALMGQAYISGLHIGSANRLAVVAKHFPGVGSSDRPIAEEVPTVRKSLAELERVELAPFFAVTGGANQPTAVADALLATHARYQNFQGNISATTPPVSFDPQALTSLMSLPQFSQWRQNGGIIVSDALGQRSVQRFYDDTNQEFPHRRVARDALLAGNDLLYLDNFALGSDPSYEAQLANLRDTVLWFQERYLTDLPFQQRVDQAVLRIIQLKLKLYEADFNLDNVLLDGVTTAVNTPTNNAAMFDLGQSAVTLISPDPVELASRLSSPPNSEERILIFTDMRYSQQCAECAPEPYISATALEETILLLYGANASNQVRANQISSFTFDELAQFLTAEPDSLIYPPPATAVAPEPTATRDLTILPDDLPDDSPTMTPQPTATPQPTPTPSPAFLIQEGLNEADWIIFALLDVDEAHQTLNNFLAARPDLVRSSKVIVFAYNAPYYLDTTEISKLTAYFGVYSKIPTFVNASVRALFQESPLLGLPPVDVAGIGYHLAQQVQPSPNQVIELYVVDEGTAQSPPSEAPLPAEIGDTLHLQTGIIRDHNGNPVPDGTIVQFIQQDRIQGVVSIVAERTTQQGVATLDYVLEARTGAGQFRITAVSGTATASQEVDITIADAAQVAVITPTPTPTATATPSPTSTATPTPTATAVVPTSTPSPAPLPEEPGIRINLSDLQMVLALMVGLVTTLGLGVYLSREAALVQRVRWPLWGIVGGLLVYIYYQLELPGTAVVGQWGSWGGLLSTLLGGLLGLLLFALYKEIQPK